MDFVVIVSADGEWRVTRELLPQAAIESTPLGETFVHRPRGSQAVRFFHGGWGKISAAATAQYILDRFHPDVLINLGTCGGFEGRIERGRIVMVDRTVVYDIIEQMTDPDAAIRHYATEIDLSWLKQPYPHPVQRGLLVSGDRDIVSGDIPMLIERYGAAAADWESGSIAWVAQRNGIRLLILRGVSDLVGSAGGEVYGDYDSFIARTREVMKDLIRQLPDWIGHISS